MKEKTFLSIVFILNCISILYVYYNADMFLTAYSPILILIYITVIIDMSLLPGTIVLLYLALFKA